MQSTMQDFPLTITAILRHGQKMHARSQVHTFDGQGLRSASFADTAARAGRLAAALTRLGVGPGDRVGTFMWNTAEHQEAYFAVPCMGAVLHTLNVRLFPRQLVHVVNEAADRVVLVHASAAPLLARVAGELKTVEHYVLVDDGVPVPGEVRAALGSVLGYEDLLAAEATGIEWPELDEQAAAIMCYTSGTTGDPKGVVYSHRSTFLHAFAGNNAGSLHFTDRQSVLVVVPMFHVNAWGYPYTAWMTGADIVMPARFMQGEGLARIIELARPTIAAGVPTLWAGLLRYVQDNPGTDLSSLEQLVSGGSALPRALLEAYDRLGVPVIQGWGMTETSPVCAVSGSPKGADPGDPGWRLKTGRVIPGVELRIVAEDGAELPWDGRATGEIEVRGPWITGSYYGDPAPQTFHDGWLRTGDVASVDERGYVQITDRVKDMIKSGGEWISSVDLENELMGHPDVVEASVVGVSDERWGERPLAVVVRRPGSAIGPDQLREYLSGRIPRWWLPERWVFVDEVPKTSVGKFDKKALRATYAAGETQAGGAPQQAADGH